MDQCIKDFLVLLRALQKIDPEFPLQYAICLSEIALEEGQSLTTLALKTGMPLSTVSRVVGALSGKRQRGIPYGLVRVTLSQTERRKKELYLTPRGLTAIQCIVDIIKENQDARLRA